MNFELTKKLKDAGFAQAGENFDSDFGFITDGPDNDQCYVPLLSELIEACGDAFDSLNYILDGGIDGKEKLWWAVARRSLVPAAHERGGETPEEAVAYLWLALNTK